MPAYWLSHLEQFQNNPLKFGKKLTLQKRQQKIIELCQKVKQNFDTISGFENVLSLISYQPMGKRCEKVPLKRNCTDFLFEILLVEKCSNSLKTSIQISWFIFLNISTKKFSGKKSVSKKFCVLLEIGRAHV